MTSELGKSLKRVGRGFSLVLMLCLARALDAQVEEGAVSGMVTDQAGQVIVQAQVALFNHQAAIVHTRTTNGSGFYSFAKIGAGSYTLIVSSPGFDTYIQEGIRVDAGTHSGQSVELKIVESGENADAMSSAGRQAEEIPSGQPFSTPAKDPVPVIDRTPSSAQPYGIDVGTPVKATKAVHREQAEKETFEIGRSNLNLQLFGKMDADGEWVHTSRPGPGVAPSRARIASNASRFGARGSVKLAENIKAVWQIASRVSLNGTETGGGGGLFTLWGNSRVGLETGFGTVFVGVWDTPYRQSYDFVDMFDGSHIASPIALLGSIGNGISANAALPTIQQQFPLAVAGARVGCTNFYRRQKNSLQYWSPRLHALEFKVGYSADDSGAKARGIDPSLFSASAAYIKNPVYISIGFEQHKDMKSVNGVSAAGIDYGTRLTVSYRFDGLRLGLVAERLSYSVSGDPRASRGALSVFAMHKKRAQSWAAAYTYAGDLSGAPDTGAQEISLRYGYAFSKFTELFAQYVSILNRPHGTYNFGDGLDISTGPGAALWGSGFGLAFAF